MGLPAPALGGVLNLLKKPIDPVRPRRASASSGTAGHGADLLIVDGRGERRV
jgi:hypothetical protein